METRQKVSLNLTPEQWELLLSQLESRVDMVKDGLEHATGPDEVRLSAAELEVATLIRRAVEGAEGRSRMQLWIGHALGDETDWFLVWARSKAEAIEYIDGSFWEPDVRSMRQLEDLGYVLFHAEVDGKREELTLQGVLGLEGEAEAWVEQRLKEPLGEPTTREVSDLAATMGIETPEVLRVWMPDQGAPHGPNAEKAISPALLAQAIDAARSENEVQVRKEIPLDLTPEQWGILLGELDVMTDMANEVIEDDTPSDRERLDCQAELDLAAMIRRQLDAVAGPAAVAEWEAAHNSRLRELSDPGTKPAGGDMDRSEPGE